MPTMMRRIGPNRLRDCEGFAPGFDSVVAVVAVVAAAVSVTAVVSVDDGADDVLGGAAMAVSEEAVVALDVVAGGGVGVMLGVSVVTVCAVAVVEGTGAGAGFCTFRTGGDGGVVWTGVVVARASRTTG